MNATFETAAFTALSVMGLPYAIKSLGADHLPPMLVGICAALIQRTVSAFAKNVNKDLEKEKKNQDFIKTVDSTIAGLTAYLLTPSLIRAAREDLQQTDKELPPAHPAALIIVGTATFGAAKSAFDYVSPSKLFTKIAEFPTKKLPLGGYAMSFGAALIAADQVQQLIKKMNLAGQGGAGTALIFAAAAGTFTAIVLTDLLSPSKQKTEKSNH
jgi:hypothetical protein